MNVCMSIFSFFFRRCFKEHGNVSIAFDYEHLLFVFVDSQNLNLKWKLQQRKDFSTTFINKKSYPWILFAYYFINCLENI